MELINKVRNYILEEEFKINIYKNKVNVINYETIDHFDDNKVLIKYNEGLLKITGDHLVVSKLMIDEVLILGNIKSIELR